MQVARYWRMKKQNYRLEGFRHTSGQVSLQPRPTEDTAQNRETTDEVAAVKISA
ncbi:MAG: hypothetical protein MUE40_01800 [Anaerolineae bacterium]|nr:hypothetical protein [Anaerolineae bacterium]